jgi:hypothetical protein
MNILRRYVAREIISSTLLVLVAFLGLFAFFDFVNELDSIGKDGYQLHHALIYVALIMPGRVYELMPIAVLIGTLYALTNLARHSEITVDRAAARAAGVGGYAVRRAHLHLWRVCGAPGREGRPAVAPDGHRIDGVERAAIGAVGARRQALHQRADADTGTHHEGRAYL